MAREVCGVLFVSRGRSSKVFDPKGAVGKAAGGKGGNGGKGGWERVTRLYRRGDVLDEQCWLKAPDWALAYA